MGAFLLLVQNFVNYRLPLEQHSDEICSRSHRSGMCLSMYA